MDIKSLRATRSTDFSKITKELEKVANPQNQNQEDNRFWKLERDKSGNGSAVIRFLPKTENDELPWVRHYTHGFQGPTGRWYIEDSLSTIGQEDGIAVLNRELWNSGSDASKEQARKQKRRLSYIANILVISDPKHPENEGKVFLYRFGKKIFDKVMDAARPTFEDETPVNVFDLWEGANFKLRIKTVENYPNYDQSVFDSPSELFGGDEERLLELMNTAHPLHEIVDPKKFKSREELDKKLAWVLDSKQKPTKTAEEDMGDDVAEMLNESKPVVTRKEKTAEAPPIKEASAKDDDLDSFFSQFDIDD